MAPLDAGHAPRAGGGDHHSAGAGRHVPGHVVLGHRAAQDLAGLAHHRAGLAGGRRHHCRGDDGAQNGRGLRQGAFGHFCLRDHGHAHAHRHAHHGSGLPAHRYRQIDGGGIHLCHLRRDGDRTRAVVDRVGLFCALSGHAAAQGAAACARHGGRARRAARDVRHAVLRHLPPPGELVRGAPLAHHRRHVADFRAGPVGYGQGAAAVLPRFEPSRGAGRSLAARGQFVCRERGGGAARRDGAARAARGANGERLGGIRGAAFLPAAGPGVSADQRVAVHRAAPGLEGARNAAHGAARVAGAGISRSARTRQAAAQWAAGAVPGAVPRGRARPGRTACAR